MTKRPVRFALQPSREQEASTDLNRFAEAAAAVLRAAQEAESSPQSKPQVEVLEVSEVIAK